MAVPKKKTSKAKTRSRKAIWKRKAVLNAGKALSLALSNRTNNSNSYVSTADLSSNTI